MENLIREMVLYITAFKWMVTVQKYFLVLSTPGLWQLLVCFFLCSFLMISRLNAIEKNGFEGTVIGTLVMPYFSGFPNLCFAWLLIGKPGGGRMVVENCLVNNLTNLTLVLGIPCLVWGLNLSSQKKDRYHQVKINRLSLILSLFAALFFCLFVLLLAKDPLITKTDGLLLIVIFLFWQLYHIFDLLKTNTRAAKQIKKTVFIDFFIIGLCAWGIFSSTDHLIQWVEFNGTGFFSKANMGIISGILMVIPNAFLAFWYTAVKRGEIAYSSQIGDCHICIPLCIGLYALFSPIRVDPYWVSGFFMLMGACCLHLMFNMVSGRLSRPAGLLLVVLYGFYMVKEII